MASTARGRSSVAARVRGRCPGLMRVSPQWFVPGIASAAKATTRSGEMPEPSSFASAVPRSLNCDVRNSSGRSSRADACATQRREVAGPAGGFDEPDRYLRVGQPCARWTPAKDQIRSGPTCVLVAVGAATRRSAEVALSPTDAWPRPSSCPVPAGSKPQTPGSPEQSISAFEGRLEWEEGVRRSGAQAGAFLPENRTEARS